MPRATTLLTALTLLAATSTPALAHHGWSDYGDTDFALTGTVVSANLGGPHGLLKVRTPTGVWDVVLAPPPAIQRSGLTTAAVPVGARVTARGHRHATPARLEMKTERLSVGGKTFDLYPNRD